MSHELELAAGASAGGFVRRDPSKHAAPVGTPCANCATPLQGPWCYACGQSGEDFHRSIVRLAGEAVEGLFHLDGRLWRTLPDLMVRPARLTRRYVDGHRAPQIPPLRLFLVVLLAIFLVGGITGGSKTVAVIRTSVQPDNGKPVTTTVVTKSLDQLTPDERARMSARLKDLKVSIGGEKPSLFLTGWLKDRMTRALADPQRFQLIVEEWAERFAILMLPVAALLLSLLFVFQRRFYLFDHTIFSLHSLSAVGLMLIAGMLIHPLIGGWADLLYVAASAHLFFHMRGVYQTSVVGTLLRMFLLFIGSSVAAGLLIVGLVAVGLGGMGS